MCLRNGKIPQKQAPLKRDHEDKKHPNRPISKETNSAIKILPSEKNPGLHDVTKNKKHE
jgi:hypothetical protein